ALLYLLMIGGAVNAMGRSFQTPTLYALISHNSDPAEQGLVFGLNQSLGSIARVIGPIIAAAAYHVNISGPFLVSAAIMVIVILWTISLRSSTNDGAGFPLPAEASAAESV